MEAHFMSEPTAIYAELDRILSSTPFAASHRSKRFLRYIVENSFDNAHEPLKEYAIALAVFDRDASYDPSIDATVRVEAGRLRSRLRDYYSGEGRNDTLIINVPKGAYRATFVGRPPLEKFSKPVANPLLPSRYPGRRLRTLRSWRRGIHTRNKRYAPEISQGPIRSRRRPGRTSPRRSFPARGTAARPFLPEEL
jgi:hypothetical protein